MNIKHVVSKASIKDKNEEEGVLKNNRNGRHRKHQTKFSPQIGGENKAS
jgi:uncharacterized protein YdaU (DUF1376 family)